MVVVILVVEFVDIVVVVVVAGVVVVVVMGKFVTEVVKHENDFTTIMELKNKKRNNLVTYAGETSCL